MNGKEGQLPPDEQAQKDLGQILGEKGATFLARRKAKDISKSNEIKSSPAQDNLNEQIISSDQPKTTTDSVQSETPDQEENMTISKVVRQLYQEGYTPQNIAKQLGLPVEEVEQMSYTDDSDTNVSRESSEQTDPIIDKETINNDATEIVQLPSTPVGTEPDNRADNPPVQEVKPVLDQDEIYALRGGKEQYDKLIDDYRRLNELEDQGANQKPNFLTSKDKKMSHKEWDRLRVDIVLREYMSLSVLAKAWFDDQTDLNYSGIKEIVDELPSEVKKKMNEFIRMSLDGKSYKKMLPTSKTLLKVAKNLEERNFAALRKDRDFVKTMENLLSQDKSIIMKEFESNAVDIEKLYLNFDDQPKPAVATPATGLEVVDQAKPKTNQEKFLEAADEITNSWDDKQKQTLAKLCDVVLFFQKRYLEQVLTNQPDMSDEDKTAFKIVAKNYAKTYAAQQYSDSRLDLPKIDKEAVIKLIPELFSQSD